MKTPVPKRNKFQSEETDYGNSTEIGLEVRVGKGGKSYRFGVSSPGPSPNTKAMCDMLLQRFWRYLGAL